MTTTTSSMKIMTNPDPREMDVKIKIKDCTDPSNPNVFDIEESLHSITNTEISKLPKTIKNIDENENSKQTFLQHRVQMYKQQQEKMSKSSFHTMNGLLTHRERILLLNFLHPIPSLNPQNPPISMYSSKHNILADLIPFNVKNDVKLEESLSNTNQIPAVLSSKLKLLSILIQEEETVMR